MDGNTITSFLENSNGNGFGFLVVVVLFYLFVFFLIQYFQHKKLFYLLYSLYALVNGTNLLKYIEGVFFSDFFNAPEGSLVVRFTHYPSQLFGTLFFTYFLIEIMQLRNSYSKSIRFINYFYLIISPIYLVLWAIYMANPNSYLIDYFHMVVFIPSGYLMFFWMFYMVYQQKVAIKWYIISGMSVLVTTYFIISYLSTQEFTANHETLYFFYIGILVESLLFALAIGLEQKVVYTEKAAVQRKYISQLEENQMIKESINRMLSEELAQTKSSVLEISAEAQKERTEKLTMKFEHKFSQLRLNALRSQMNPHFIFNALNSIKSYTIENNQEKAIFYLTKFSKLIRSILESSREEQITLAEELRTLEMYIEIENDRFKNDIEFLLEVDQAIDTHKVKVPALFLQPFVENAIWHGLSTKKGKKTLCIKVSRSNTSQNLEIRIKDNGVGRKVTRNRNAKNPFKKDSLGLSLTADRLDLFSKKQGKHYGYTITDLWDDATHKSLGTQVVVEIPEMM
ncbi:MAG: histidine kinase [Saonia sp.]